MYTGNDQSFYNTIVDQNVVCLCFRPLSKKSALYLIHLFFYLRKEKFSNREYHSLLLRTFLVFFKSLDVFFNGRFNIKQVKPDGLSKSYNFFFLYIFVPSSPPRPFVSYESELYMERDIDCGGINRVRNGSVWIEK